MSRSGLGSEPGQVGTDSAISFQLCRLLFRPLSPMQARWSTLRQKIQTLNSQAIHVADGAPDSHRETSSVGSSSNEASPVALEKSLASARGFGKDHSSAQVTPSPPGLVAERGQC